MPLRRFSPAGCFCFADACRRRLRATRSSGTRCGSASLRLPAMRGLKVINGSKGSVDMRRSAGSLVGTDRKDRRQALTRENFGETERGTAEPPALRGLRAPRVPLPRERYYPFSFSGAELPGTGTGAFILPS